MNRRYLLTFALCGLLAGCADASEEPQEPANSEQLPPPPDPSGGTAGMGEGAQDPAVTPASSPAAPPIAPGPGAVPPGEGTPPAAADTVAH